MYRITYIHKDETIENHLYIPGDADYCLLSGTLDLECGKSGELSIALPDINPAKEDILCLTDEVIVYRDQEEIWRGRPVTMQMDFDRTGTLTCEGILSYLYDSAFPPFEFEGSPKEFLQMVLDNHNSQVEARKQFTLGDVTVEDNNDYINRSSIYYDKSLNVLVEKLIEDSLGGYFRVRIENDTRYLDYLETYGTEATQMVEYGSNLLDIAEEIEYSDLATVILPLGARLTDDEGLETDEYLTIASVNGGSEYYADEAAVATYGWIVVIAEWEDVTLPENLLEKAKTYLTQCTSAISSFTVNAIDLSLISGEEPIRLGDFVWIRSIAHGINQYIELTEQHIDILYPENDVLSFGTDTSTLTGSQKTTERAVQSALGSLDLRVTNLTTDVINAVYANIETIVADTVNANYIYGIVAELGYLTADEIDAKYVSIENLYADVADFGFLTADSAVVTDLTAFAENVYTLLGGTGSFGELEAINLTSDHVVIEQAVIAEAIAGTMLADLLYAEYIDTNLIHVGSEDGTLWISDSTILISDANGNYRIQIGLDDNGDYNLALWDADGNCMWNAAGATEYGINDGVIRDSMVADDAAISGYKLNIQEIVGIINSDSSYTIEAASVTIDGQGLDAWYTQINDQIAGLEGLTFDGLTGITRYYCYWESATEAPPEDEDITPAICGEAICGLTICGLTDGTLWQTEPIPATEGLYRWCKLLGEYSDGHTEWGLPYCLDDGYTREQTQVLQTELSVVQGQIEARIWETDITEAVDPLYGYVTSLEDQYADLVVTVSGIYAEVGDLQTTVEYNYQEFDTRITSISADLDGISMTVSNVEQSMETMGTTIEEIESQLENIEGVTNMQPYWCLWESGEEAPPDNDELTPAICGEAVCGLTICGVTDGILWTTEEPEPDEGYYTWVKYLLTFRDDHTEWRGPYCLTDSYTRSMVSGAWSQLQILDDSITSTVAELSSSVNMRLDDLDSGYDDLSDTVVNNYEYLYTMIEQTSTDINLTISESLGTIYETEDSILSTLEQYNTYFTFDSDGLRISKSNSPFAVVLGTERLSFTENDAEIAYISNSMLYIHDAEVITSLKIGAFRWEIGSPVDSDDSHRNLNLVKVSEKEYDPNEEPDSEGGPDDDDPDE